MFDAHVIVAGAGPAGAVAARTLAAAGIDTLLVDRAVFPRNKPCGGGLTTRALRRFPWLSGTIQSIDASHIAALDLECPDGNVLPLRSENPVAVLFRRLDFDAALVDEARANGARLKESFEVTQVAADRDGVTLQSRSGDKLRGRFVIAADGVHSVIAKRLGVNRKWSREALALDMMEETPIGTLRAATPTVAWVSYGYRGLDGYAYIFPKPHHVNVGIGCVLSHFDKNVTDRPVDMQSKLVTSLVDDGMLAGESDRKCFTPYLIPVGGPLKQTHHHRVLFAGDAGGFVNGFTAEGIYYAMISGELAARALANGHDSPARIGRLYRRAWRAEIGSELRDSVVVQKFLFQNHERVNRIVHGGHRHPWLGEAVIAYADGRRSYRDVRRTLMLKAPRIGCRLALRKFKEWLRRPALEDSTGGAANL